MQAARIIQPNQPLQVQQLDTPRNKGSQVFVKIMSSGSIGIVCTLCEQGLKSYNRYATDCNSMKVVACSYVYTDFMDRGPQDR